MYNVTLKIADQTYEASNESLIAALGSIKPGKVHAKAVITVEKDGKRMEKLLYPFALKRLLTGKIAKDIFAKRADLVLS